jgi:FeS assembly SUF system protein
MNGQSDKELKDKVIQALKMVYDPEIPVDVYELGLIYEINIFPLNNVFILMTLTSPACPAAEMIPGDVEAKVKSIPEVNDVTVEITFDPPYTQDMMSEVAKLELGLL